MEDWDGKLYGEALAKRHTMPPTYIQPILQQFAAQSQWSQHRVSIPMLLPSSMCVCYLPGGCSSTKKTCVQVACVKCIYKFFWALNNYWKVLKDIVIFLQEDVPYTKKTKREYKKARRQHKQSSAAAAAAAANAAARESRVPQYNDVDILGQQDLYSSEDEVMSPVSDSNSYISITFGIRKSWLTSRCFSLPTWDSLWAISPLVFKSNMQLVEIVLHLSPRKPNANLSGWLPSLLAA